MSLGRALVIAPGRLDLDRMCGQVRQMMPDLNHSGPDLQDLGQAKRRVKKLRNMDDGDDDATLDEANADADSCWTSNWQRAGGGLERK